MEYFIKLFYYCNNWPAFPYESNWSQADLSAAFDSTHWSFYNLATLGPESSFWKKILSVENRLKFTNDLGNHYLFHA